MLHSPPPQPLRQSILKRLNSTHHTPTTPTTHTPTTPTTHTAHTPARLDNQDDELLNRISQLEKEGEDGYLNYSQWVQFNRKEYPHLTDATINTFWKILRVLNEGEVYISTGLLFQIATYLNAKRTKHPTQTQSLKQVVDNYLRLNTGESLSHFRQLKSFPSLDSIEQAYCPPPTLKTQQSQPKLANTAQVYNRIYNDAQVRQKSRRKQQYISLVQQSSAHTFTPAISHYKSHSQLKRCDRICQHPHSHPHPQPQVTPPVPFKASPIDPRIYLTPVLAIPGAELHIHRSKFSEAERQRMSRYLARPCGKSRAL